MVVKTHLSWKIRFQFHKSFATRKYASVYRSGPHVVEHDFSQTWLEHLNHIRHSACGTSSPLRVTTTPLKLHDGSFHARKTVGMFQFFIIVLFFAYSPLYLWCECLKSCWNGTKLDVVRTRQVHLAWRRRWHCTVEYRLGCLIIASTKPAQRTQKSSLSRFSLFYYSFLRVPPSVFSISSTRKGMQSWTSLSFFENFKILQTFSPSLRNIDLFQANERWDVFPT